MKEESDSRLVEEARNAENGDYRAFEELVSRHQAFALENCRLISGSRDLAEDLAQEVFVKAYFALDGVQQGASFKAWLRRLKVNHCIDHLRSVHRDVLSSSFEYDEEYDQGSGADSGESATTIRVRAVLASLPEKYRVPLIMADADGIPYDEIASALGLSLSAVKMRVKRARELYIQRNQT